MKSIGYLIILPIAVYVLLCLYLYLVQRSMLYYPTMETRRADAKQFHLTNDHHSLKIWHVDRKSQKALLYFGGNAEDVSGSIGYISKLFPDHDIYLANYRGYGGSSGVPSESAILSDAVALYDFLANTHSDMIAMGRSLGSGVAVHIASSRPVDKLILITPYDSMVNVARHYYPFMPVGLLLKDRYDSLAKVEMVQIPTLILIAEHDEVIPRKNSMNLALAMSAVGTDVRVIGGAGHNDIELSSQFHEAISSFIAE